MGARWALGGRGSARRYCRSATRPRLTSSNYVAHMDTDGLRTERLRLRRWDGNDRSPFADLNSDPLVMEYLPSILTRAESDAFVDRIEQHFDEHDYGLWAVELTETDEFVGFVGLRSVTFDAPFTPATEVGWRLARQFWGSGLAPEAAQAAIADGFQRLGLTEIVSFTSVINLKSRRVMEKLGMTQNDEDNFDHPAVVEGHPLRAHVLYRLASPTIAR